MSKSSSLTRKGIDYTPLCPLEFFDEKKLVNIDKRGSFQIYLKGKTGILILAIHSFGSCALTWAAFAKEIHDVIDCQIIAIDLRNHGNSRVTNYEDLSLNTLAEDVKAVISKHFTSGVPNIHIMGHSTGGSIGLKIAEVMPVQSVTIIDGTQKDCMDFTPELEKIMNSRRPLYENLEDAIFDYVTTGYSSNIECARAVVPAMMVNLVTSRAASEDVCGKTDNGVVNKSNESLSLDIKPVRPSLSSREGSELFKGKFKWRAEYRQCQNYWRGWYEEYTNRFLAFSGHKLLLLTQPYELDPKIQDAISKNQLEYHLLKRKALLVHESDAAQIILIYKQFLLKNQLISQLK